MDIPTQPRDRNTIRAGTEITLAKAERAFQSALSLFGDKGNVEDIRQARLNLALIHSFQTSLQHGSTDLTAVVADTLASTGSITLRRELFESISTKFRSVEEDDVKWPKLDRSENSADPSTNLDDPTGDLRDYWTAVKARHVSHSLPASGEYDLSSLPTDWAVISINITEDRNTMFVSRHQNGHDPLVFCLPLDRQGRREGDDEEDIFTFSAALAELKEIVDTSDYTARNAKHIKDRQGKMDWWTTRTSLDKRMEEMLLNMEHVWLGPFKVSRLLPLGRFGRPPNNHRLFSIPVAA